jgi:hypothetical protein
MDGQIKKRRTLEAIKRFVLRESLNQPLMVIFEDLHWIDEQPQNSAESIPRRSPCRAGRDEAGCNWATAGI